MGVKPLWVHAQDLLIAGILDALGQAQISLEIEDPTGDAVGILAEQRALAGGDLEFVKIVPGFVAIVQSDDRLHRDRSWAR